MRVMLIKPPEKLTLWNAPVCDLGFGYLATALKRKGHEVELIDCITFSVSEERLLQRIRNNRPDVLGMKLYTKDMHSGQHIARRIKQDFPEILLLAGGPYPSGDPEHLMRMIPELDFAFKGEADVGLPMLLEAMDQEGALDPLVLDRIPGLVRRINGETRVNTPVFVEDLDSLGWPDWKAMQLDKFRDYYRGPRLQGRYVPIMTSRGCPFSCRFCAAEHLSGKKMRFRSNADLMDELEYLRDTFGISRFSIVDDNFISSREHILSFCESLMERKINMKWNTSTNGIRLNVLDREIITTMERSGCYSVAVGMESGSQRVLDLMNKRLKAGDIEKGVSLIKSASSMWVHAFIILGFPGETEEDIKETIHLATRIPLDSADFFLFSPHPGTPVWNELKASGRLDEIDLDNFYYENPVEDLSRVSARRLRFYQKYAYFSFYLLTTRFIRGLFRIRNLRQVQNIFFHLLTGLTPWKKKRADNYLIEKEGS
jgi:anaerobic magnesium-protoporphyrin IX monomethyl ester cyclase